MALNQCSLAEEYQSGASLADLAEKHGLPRPTIRSRLAKLGILRSRGDGVRLAAAAGKMSRFGPRAPLSDDAKANMRAARNAYADVHSVGVSLKPSGYVEYTRGPNKGRSEHVVLIEQRIGRRILPDEVVHHIDGDRSNNSIDNLALMTRAAHARLHRREEALSKGKNRVA